MNSQENIIYLAQQNAKNIKPKTLETINQSLPYFKLFMNDDNKLDIKGYNYSFHDNAPRMSLWEMYMKQLIIPNLNNNKNLCGYYNIELHDSYTYLKNDKNYTDVFTFSKFKNDSKPVLIPDPYMICNWNNQLDYIKDNISFEDKYNILYFYGTTTGNRNPELNERINMCLWSLNKSNYDFKITKVAQMNTNDIIKYTGIQNWNKIHTLNRISIDEQLKYKYHLILDGNTCRFDIWNFKTNSLSFKYKSNEMLWYYPFLQDREHFIEVDKNNMDKYINYYNNNPKEANRIIQNANDLANTYFNNETHILYTKTLFEEISQN